MSSYTSRPKIKKKNGTKNVCDNDDLEKVLDEKLIMEIHQPEKFKFIIDQQYFFNMCYEINMIMAKFGYFLRVFEFKNKYRHLTMKRPDRQQKIVRQLSSCLIEKYDGFMVVSIEYQKKREKNLSQSISFINQQKKPK